MVKIPHSMPISLQPIDKEGRALQVMRSWLAAQPGERVSCVGCHEPSSASPNPRPSMAALKAPRVLEPWSKVDKPYPYKGDDGRNDVSAKYFPASAGDKSSTVPLEVFRGRRRRRPFPSPMPRSGSRPLP